VDALGAALGERCIWHQAFLHRTLWVEIFVDGVDTTKEDEAHEFRRLG
jgi:hypothetical protein